MVQTVGDRAAAAWFKFKNGTIDPALPSREPEADGDDAMITIRTHTRAIDHPFDIQKDDTIEVKKKPNSQRRAVLRT